MALSLDRWLDQPEMSATVQQVVPKLCASEVWALYGGELEYCLGGDEEEEQEAEVRRCGKSGLDGSAVSCKLRPDRLKYTIGSVV